MKFAERRQSTSRFTISKNLSAYIYPSIHQKNYKNHLQYRKDSVTLPSVITTLLLYLTKGGCSE